MHPTVETIIYLILPSLLIAVVLASVWLERWSVPVILVALGTGILFGSDVMRWWDFHDMLLTNRIANIALVFILFHGGFITKREDFRPVALLSGGLATWGVMLTAGITYVVLHWGLGWDNELSLLLAVIVSSTDAAAIFSILRRQSLPKRLSSTVEIESAANDPMAILLTTITVAALSVGKSFGAGTVLTFLWKFGAGPVIGYVLAHITVWLFNQLRAQDRGYYYVLFMGVVPIIYGLSEQAHASGMLAIFTAGYVMGNSSFVHKHGILSFSDALSVIANIGMFVVMGALASPSTWATLWPKGLILFVVVTFIGRPLAVFLGTMGMKFGGFKNRLFTSWAGLRGSVPIVLATYPAAAGMEIGPKIFSIVFFVVILSILIQGSTLGVVAKWLGLSEPSRPGALFSLEMRTMAPTDYDLVVIDLPGPKGAKGLQLRDLKLPKGATIALISRGAEVVQPTGSTHLEGWDQVTLLAHAPDEQKIRESLQSVFLHPDNCPDSPTQDDVDA